MSPICNMTESSTVEEKKLHQTVQAHCASFTQTRRKDWNALDEVSRQFTDKFCRSDLAATAHSPQKEEKPLEIMHVSCPQALKIHLR